MAASGLELMLVEALEKAAEGHGIDIVDVEVVGAKSSPVVRVRIDHLDEDAPGITLDEVSAQSGWVNEVVEAVDPFPGSYMLEVSSPGLARPLRRVRDFERFAGETVQLTTTAREGRRRFTGELVGMVGEKVTLACDDGEHAFGLSEIKSCTIKPTFDFSSKRDAGEEG